MGAQLRKIKKGPVTVEAVELRLTRRVRRGHAQLGKREKQERRNSSQKE